MKKSVIFHKKRNNNEEAFCQKNKCFCDMTYNRKDKRLRALRFHTVALMSLADITKLGKMHLKYA